MWGNSATWGKARDDHPPQALTLHGSHQIEQERSNWEKRRGGEPNAFMLIDYVFWIASFFKFIQRIKPHPNVTHLMMRCGGVGCAKSVLVPELWIAGDGVY
jgi:hypothetical protein